MYSQYMMIRVADQFGCRKRDKGEFGIEIEVEGVDLPAGKITKSFEGKPDGSLRGGMEYVSRPLVFEEVTECVSNLGSQLSELKADVRPSYRCSTHIHHDYSQDTFKDVIGSIIAWSLVEPVAFQMLPANSGRDGSLFCVTSYDSGDFPEFMERFCKDISGRFHAGFHPRGKYSSQNLTRLGPSDHHALGTLEYRIFPMTLDGKLITEWCSWLRNMKKLVLSEEDHSFLSLVRTAEQKPQVFIENIFGECPFNASKASEMMDFGARTAFEMARVVSKYLKEKPKEKKSKPKEEFVINDDLPAGAVPGNFLNVGARFGELPPVMVGGAAQPAENFPNPGPNVQPVAARPRRRALRPRARENGDRGNAQAVQRVALAQGLRFAPNGDFLWENEF